MERNENGKPVRQNSGTGGNVIENFFDNQPNACQNSRNGGCQNPENSDTGMDFDGNSFPLAYAYVPMQKWRRLYSPADGLHAGTLFEELNKPLGVYGNE